MSIRDKLNQLRQSEATNAEHERRWKTKRTLRLRATRERRDVWEACVAYLESEDDSCTCRGCTYKYKCEEYFPVETPWGQFTIPADYRLEGEFYVIEKPEDAKHKD